MSPRWGGGVRTARQRSWPVICARYRAPDPNNGSGFTSPLVSAAELGREISRSRDIALAFMVDVAMVAPHALVAQLDRASDFDSEGRRFESFRARQTVLPAQYFKPSDF
jgi:hypothetical protein